MKAIFKFGRVASFCLLFSAIFSHAQWAKISGPDSIRVLAAGAWPAIYAGTRSGIFLSVDSGAHWSPVNSGLTHLSIRSITLRPGIIFVGAESGGIFRSTNNGTSWTPANNGLTGLDVRAFKFHEGKLFAGTNDGVFRSTDSGASWSKIGIGITTSPVNTLEFYLGALYAGTEGGGVFSTADGGATWSTANPGLTSLNVRSLVWDGSYLYAGAGDGAYALRLNSFPDPGWKQEGLGTTSSPNVRALVTSGAFPDIYAYKFAGTQGSGVFLSNPSGPNWSPINEGLTEMDVHAVAISGGYLFAGTDGGVWRRPASQVMNYTSIRAGKPNMPWGFLVNGHRSISFTLPVPSRVTLEAFTPDGRRAALLLSERLPAGSHTRRLNTASLPNGLYFYHLRVGAAVETRKVLLSK